jgi:hypothetical protein
MPKYQVEMLSVSSGNEVVSPKRGKLLIALSAFRVGLGGDHGQRLRSARVQARTALEVLGTMDNVDTADPLERRRLLILSPLAA